jgi:ribosomal protein L14
MDYVDNTFSRQACLKVYSPKTTEKVMTSLGEIIVKHAKSNAPGINQQLRWEVVKDSQTE